MSLGYFVSLEMIISSRLFFSSAYDYVIPAKGKLIAKTDIQIALPDGCYGRVGKTTVNFSGYRRSKLKQFSEFVKSKCNLSVIS